MWFKCITYSLAVAYSISLSSQTVTTSAILASVHADPAVRYHAQYVDKVKTTPAQLSFAEEISLRTETDRFEASRQEYLARLSVNGLRQIRETKAMHAMEITEASQEQKIYVHEAVMQRYEAIANYYFAMKSHALDAGLVTVYDDRSLVLQKLAIARPGESADDLIRTEYNRDEVELDMLRDSADMIATHQLLQTWLPDMAGDWILDTTAFISMPGIVSVISGIPNEAVQHPQYGDLQTDIAQIEQESRLVTAGSRKMLDFVQVRYSNSPTQPFRNDIGVGLGISLPFRGSARPKLAALEIEHHEADMQARIFAEQIETEIALAKSKINALMAQYHHALQQWNDSQAKFTLTQSSSVQPDGPITMLRARELQLQRELQLLDMQKEIVENYLVILDLTGYASMEPRVNYLSANLESW